MITCSSVFYSLIFKNGAVICFQVNYSLFISRWSRSFLFKFFFCWQVLSRWQWHYSFLSCFSEWNKRWIHPKLSAMNKSPNMSFVTEINWVSHDTFVTSNLTWTKIYARYGFRVKLPVFSNFFGQCNIQNTPKLIEMLEWMLLAMCHLESLGEVFENQG